MTIIQPREWQVCKECGEWFVFDKEIKKCPDCDGELVKTCSICGQKIEDCSCSEENLKKRCTLCGFNKEECKCKN